MKIRSISPGDGGETPPLPRECRGEVPSPSISATFTVSEYWYFDSAKIRSISLGDGEETPPLPRECRGEVPSPNISATFTVSEY